MKKKQIGITIAVIAAAVALTVVALYQIPALAPYLPSLRPAEEAPPEETDPVSEEASPTAPGDEHTLDPYLVDILLYAPGEEMPFAYSYENPDKSVDRADWTFWAEDVQVGKSLHGFQPEDLFILMDDDRFTEEEREVVQDGALTSPQSSLLVQLTCRNNLGQAMDFPLGNMRLRLWKRPAQETADEASAVQEPSSSEPVSEPASEEPAEEADPRLLTGQQVFYSTASEMRQYRLLTDGAKDNGKGTITLGPGEQVTVELLYILPDQELAEYTVLMPANLSGRDISLRRAGIAIPCFALSEPE
ncbi:MAG TPA: hypothetical protein H9674_07235 [Firmicutes bacterium]|nr:hypothetical protein [Bacillota bacterium]